MLPDAEGFDEEILKTFSLPLRSLELTWGDMT